MMANGETLDATTGVLLSLTLRFPTLRRYACDRLALFSNWQMAAVHIAQNITKQTKQNKQLPFQIPKSKFPPYIIPNQMWCKSRQVSVVQTFMYLTDSFIFEEGENILVEFVLEFKSNRASSKYIR